MNQQNQARNQTENQAGDETTHNSRATHQAGGRTTRQSGDETTHQAGNRATHRIGNQAGSQADHEAGDLRQCPIDTTNGSRSTNCSRSNHNSRSTHGADQPDTRRDASTQRLHKPRPTQSLHDLAIRAAVSQAGVLTRKQLLSLGFTDRMIEGYIRLRKFSRLLRGVYYTVTGEPSAEALRWAGQLACGPESFIYGYTALEVWGYGKPSLPIRLAIPARSIRIDQDWIEVVRVKAYRSTKLQGDLAIESPADALIDACRNLKDPLEIENLIADLVQRRIVRLRDLDRAITMRKIPHRRIFTDTINLLGDGRTTPLEIAADRKVLRAHGFTGDTAQVNMGIGDSTRIADLVFIDYQVIVEFDGRLGHADARGKFRDMDRDNLATLQGFSTLRFGWNDVMRAPCRVALQIAKALVLRGWQGELHTCSKPNCSLRGTPWV